MIWRSGTGAWIARIERELLKVFEIPADIRILPVKYPEKNAWLGMMLDQKKPDTASGFVLVTPDWDCLNSEK